MNAHEPAPTTAQLTLTDFLVARIAEDESATKYDRPLNLGHSRWAGECEAKRRIVALCNNGRQDWPVEELQEDILAALALPYADHPDYRDEWRP